MARSRLLPLLVLWLLAMLACGLASAAPGQPAHRIPPRTYVLSPQDCRNLVDATPAPDLAYRPGVAADGHAVAPADLPGGSRIALPQAFPVGINLYIGNPAHLNGSPDITAGSRTGIGSPPPRPPTQAFTFAPEAQVGELAVVRTPIGYELYFNGQPLEEPEQLYVRHACADWRAGHPSN